jgi:hypothetical protein
MEQAELFENPSECPLGLRYVPELFSRTQERRLLDQFQELEFKPFEFHGFLGKRRIVSFGWRYDFNGGWYKDRSVFGDVVGVSLLSACTFRLRKKASSAWRRVSLELAARSAYLLQGEVRREWEHGIPEVANLRYSITFRNCRA